MTTPQRYVEDVIVDIVKMIAPERVTTRDDIAKITEHFDFQQVVDEILPLNEDETLDLLDTLAESLPKTLHKNTSQALSWRFYSRKRRCLMSKSFFFFFE
jgi:hypothetical protein